jgi:hypothetical protein
MSKDKDATAQALADTTKKRDLLNHVFLFDLDDTITQTFKHYSKTQKAEAAGEIEFVPGVLQFIADLHKRGAKIAIFSHSNGRTVYSEAAIEKLKEIGITDIPYVSLEDAVHTALKYNSPGIRFYEAEGNTHIVLNNYRTSICLVGINLSADQISRALLSKECQGRVYNAIGKGVSTLMGKIALEKLGITQPQCKEMTICTVGDAITDIIQSWLLRDELEFINAYGLWLDARNEEELFKLEAHRLVHAPNSPRPRETPDVKMLAKIRELVHMHQVGGEMPEKFDANACEKASAASKARWDEIYANELTMRDAEKLRKSEHGLVASPVSTTVESRVPITLLKHQVSKDTQREPSQKERRRQGMQFIPLSGRNAVPVMPAAPARAANIGVSAPDDSDNDMDSVSYPLNSAASVDAKHGASGTARPGTPIFVYRDDQLSAQAASATAAVTRPGTAGDARPKAPESGRFDGMELARAPHALDASDEAMTPPVLELGKFGRSDYLVQTPPKNNPGERETPLAKARVSQATLAHVAPSRAAAALLKGPSKYPYGDWHYCGEAVIGAKEKDDFEQVKLRLRTPFKGEDGWYFYNTLLPDSKEISGEEIIKFISEIGFAGLMDAFYRDADKFLPEIISKLSDKLKKNQDSGSPYFPPQDQSHLGTPAPKSKIGTPSRLNGGGDDDDTRNYIPPAARSLEREDSPCVKTLEKEYTPASPGSRDQSGSPRRAGMTAPSQVLASSTAVIPEMPKVSTRSRTPRPPYDSDVQDEGVSPDSLNDIANLRVTAHQVGSPVNWIAREEKRAEGTANLRRGSPGKLWAQSVNGSREEDKTKSAQSQAANEGPPEGNSKQPAGQRKEIGSYSLGVLLGRSRTPQQGEARR